MGYINLSLLFEPFSSEIAPIRRSISPLFAVISCHQSSYFHPILPNTPTSETCAIDKPLLLRLRVALCRAKHKAPNLLQLQNLSTHDDQSY